MRKRCDTELPSESPDRGTNAPTTRRAQITVEPRPRECDASTGGPLALPRLNARLLKPYVSFLIVVQPKEGASADILCRTIRQFVDADDRSELSASGLSQSPADDATNTEILLALAYTTHRAPPWGGLTTKVGPEHGDRVNHLVLVLQSGRLLAIHSTDDRVKDHLLRKQAKLELGGVGVLDRPALEEAFLSGEIETFWMGEGAGRRGQRGPRSKTTYGERLEDTIDAIGDQRHTLSGARAKAGEAVLGAGRDGVVGANLDHSSAWYARASDLTDFVQTVGRMLTAIRDVLKGGGGHERFVVFARYVDDLDAVEKAYDLSLTPPGASPGGIATEEETDAYDWLQTRLVGITATGKRTARIAVAGDAGETATMTVKPERGDRGSIVFRVARADGDASLAHRFIAAFDQLQPALYYESGHTVSSRGVVAEYFSDVPFGEWVFEGFDGTDIRIEKPGDQSRSAIREFGGTATDNSLFGWVIRSRTSGWLYCDDGPDELCDFVYFDETTSRLEIWHVKACKSGGQRKIAAVPYEQVCAQAMKNMPSLSLVRLTAELEARQRVGDAGPLWHDGVLTDDLSGMVAALRKPRPALRTSVNILQPHVTEDLLRKARSGSSSGLHDEQQRLRRLDHLLLATDDSVSRLGAHLHVVTLGS